MKFFDAVVELTNLICRCSAQLCLMQLTYELIVLGEGFLLLLSRQITLVVSYNRFDKSQIKDCVLVAELVIPRT